MVILWTDALIFLLILVVCALGFYWHDKEHIKRPLQKIAASKVGVASLVVLLFFVFIGLLDSVHFKPGQGKNNELISCLDYLAKPLIEQGEKTYSAPFAARLYSKEVIVLDDGTTKWGYPRLVFGGSHLTNPDIELLPDILKKAFYGLAQGVACINWFSGMDGDSGPLGLIDGKGTPRPAYTALAHLIQQLGRHPSYLGWLLLNDKHYAFVFQGAKGTVMATWAATVAPDEVNFGQPVQIIDPSTGTVTQAAKHALTVAPILVAGVPDKLVAQAKSNKDKPFTWGGDYTDAKSVSVTMGEKNIEKGLHTQSAETIAADVVAYGGNARAGNVPGGNVFMVDPNFLSYTTVPIEISAVVRLNEKNEPAKLALEYESTSGYKKAEPLDVPDNTKWHTLTWRIDDPQFVSSWAFDFRMTSGKYLVQSVTVTKLPK